MKFLIFKNRNQLIALIKIKMNKIINNKNNNKIKWLARKTIIIQIKTNFILIDIQFNKIQVTMIKII